MFFSSFNYFQLEASLITSNGSNNKILLGHSSFITETKLRSALFCSEFSLIGMVSLLIFLLFTYDIKLGWSWNWSLNLAHPRRFFLLHFLLLLINRFSDLIIELANLLTSCKWKDDSPKIWWQIVKEIENNASSHNFSRKIKGFISMNENIPVLLIALHFLALLKVYKLFASNIGWSCNICLNSFIFFLVSVITAAAAEKFVVVAGRVHIFIII